MYEHLKFSHVVFMFSTVAFACLTSSCTTSYFLNNTHNKEKIKLEGERDDLLAKVDTLEIALKRVEPEITADYFEEDEDGEWPRAKYTYLSFENSDSPPNRHLVIPQHVASGLYSSLAILKRAYGDGNDPYLGGYVGNILLSLKDALSDDIITWEEFDTINLHKDEFELARERKEERDTIQNLKSIVENINQEEKSD